jgi:hypothetical protein
VLNLLLALYYDGAIAVKFDNRLLNMDQSLDQTLLDGHCAIDSITHSLCSVVKGKVGVIVKVLRTAARIIKFSFFQKLGLFRLLAKNVKTDILQGLVRTVQEGRGIVSLSSEFFRFQAAKQL